MRIYKSRMVYEPEDYIFCMANVRGRYVKVPHPLRFSFFFSPRVGHGIRVKPVFNPDKISIKDAGNLWIHGDYKYVRSKRDENVDERYVNEMKQFFRDHKVLFAAVWEEVLNQNDLVDYFKGTMQFREMLSRFDEYESHQNALNSVDGCESLEEYVRESGWFNMND